MKNRNHNARAVVHDIDRIEELSSEDATTSQYQTSSNAKYMIIPPSMNSEEQVLRLYEKLMGEQPYVQPPVTISSVQSNKQFRSNSKLTEPVATPKQQRESPKKVTEGRASATKKDHQWFDEDISNVIKQTYAPISSKREVTSIKNINTHEDEFVNQMDIPPRSGILSKGQAKNKQNRTNYSAQYQQAKPFNTKTPTQPTTKKTVSQDKTHQDNISLKGSERIQKNTAQNFKNKLSQNMVKDKQEVTKPKGRIPPKVQPDKVLEDKVWMYVTQRLKEELMDLNYEQTLLQAELRKIHMDSKQRNLALYKSQHINNTVKSVKQLTNQEVLVLDEEQPEQIKKPILSKKLKFLNDDKEYTDDIKLQLRQLNYLIGKKQLSLRQIDQRVKSNPLHYYLYEWRQEPPQLDEEQDQQQQKVTDLKKLQKQLAEQGLTIEQFVKGKENNLARMIVKNLTNEDPPEDNPDNIQFSSYKELMRYKKNKTWMRNQRMNFEVAKPLKQSEVIQPTPQVKPDLGKIQTFELGGQGKLKVNTHLKNLLFN